MPTPEDQPIKHPERTSELPEVLKLNEHEQALLDAITPPEELLESWRQRFDTIVQSFVKSQLAPQQQQALAVYADELAWEWFGKPGEPLPPSLALYPAYGGQFSVEPKPEHSVGNPHPVRNALEEVLKPIIKEREEFFTSQILDIEDAVVEQIRSGPVYAFLRSFDIEEPDSLEQPLTPQWRQIRERQEEERVRHRFGIAAGSPIDRYSEADRALRKAQYALDEETMQRPQAQKADGRTRFMEYMKTVTKTWLDEDDRQQYGESTGLVFTTHTYTAGNVDHDILVGTTSGEEIYAGEQAADWSGYLCADEYPDTPFSIDNFDNYFASKFLYVLARQKGFAESLELAIGEQANSETHDELFNGREEISNSHLVALRRPQGTIYASHPGQETLPRIDISGVDDGIEVYGEDSLEWHQQSTVGHVLQRKMPDNLSRLITTMPAHKSYPKLQEGTPDLVIIFSEYKFDSTRSSYLNEPFIPGYEVTSHYGARWSYKRVESDPYTGAGLVEIQPDGLGQLQDMYRQIGLNELAEQLQARSRVSAAELADIIRSHSDYTFDTSLPRHSGYDGKYGLQDYSQYVKDGRLQVQCTGAASFLAVSLEMALPGGQARQIGGHVLTDSDRITGTGHAQTLLSYNGEQYILDATPEAPGGFDVTGNFGEGGGEYRRQAENHPQRARSQDNKTPKLETAENEADLEEPPQVSLDDLLEQSRESVKTSILNRVENVLRIVYDEPNNEQLYARVAKFKKDDPVRRALEAAKRLDTDNPIDLNEVLKYLDIYANADAKRISDVGLPKHDPALIAMLSNALSLG